MKINHRHYVLILFALASITISILGYIFIYKKTLLQANNYINAKTEVLSESTKVQKEAELVDIYNSTEIDRNKTESFLVYEDKIVDFIETLEKIGIDSRTTMDISTIDNSKNTVKADMSIIGSWANIMTALMLFENIPLATKINNIRLNTSGSLDPKIKGSNIWNLSLSIEALIIK